MQLTWLDIDKDAQERSRKILEQLAEPTALDELGLGNIRDSLADHLFPGTSTVQTRLRYIFFVPWIMRDHGSDREKAVSAEKKLATVLDNHYRTLALSKPREESQEDDVEGQGIIGKRAKEKIKRVPSEIYWTAFVNWGLLHEPMTQNRYWEAVRKAELNRANQRDASHRAKHARDDAEQDDDALAAATWREPWPKRPANFPAEASFTLEEDEAQFLKDTLLDTFDKRECLLADLFQSPLGLPLSKYPEPWSIVGDRRFERHWILLEHAHRFSDLATGANRFYGYMLAKLRNRVGQGGTELEAIHRKALEDWAKGTDFDRLKRWDLAEFWKVAHHRSHGIGSETVKFVDKIKQAMTDTPGTAWFSDTKAQDLIMAREAAIKDKTIAKLTNQTALNRWDGSNISGRLLFRWNVVLRFLSDLYGASKR